MQPHVHGKARPRLLGAGRFALKPISYLRRYQRGYGSGRCPSYVIFSLPPFLPFSFAIFSPESSCHFFSFSALSPLLCFVNCGVWSSLMWLNQFPSLVRNSQSFIIFYSVHVFFLFFPFARQYYTALLAYYGVLCVFLSGLILSFHLQRVETGRRGPFQNLLRAYQQPLPFPYTRKNQNPQVQQSRSPVIMCSKLVTGISFPLKSKPVVMTTSLTPL